MQRCSTNYVHQFKQKLLSLFCKPSFIYFQHQYLRSPRTIVVGDPLDVMETDSAYSGDGSNTDSGRGASEEGGENHHNGVVVPGVNSQAPAYMKGGMGTANGTDGSSYFV